MFFCNFIVHLNNKTMEIVKSDDILQLKNSIFDCIDGI